MDVKLLEMDAYERMKVRLELFINDIEQLCLPSEHFHDWLDNQDICMLLNISKRTLQHYRDCGKLPFSLVGNKCYYKVSDVEKLISDSKI